MIRSSEFGSRQPTREVTAQRYQAATQPAPQKVSGVEKLLDFGMGVAKQKHQWNKEVLEADMTAASEDYTAAIKAMQPAAFVKDPEAAMKSAGIDKLYEQIDKAPPGAQKMLRKQIDRMKEKTVSSMQATYNSQELVRATVYNATNELQSTGKLSPQYWESIKKLPPDQQSHATTALSQIAITEGHTEVFDQMLADPDMNPELRNDVERAKRQAHDRQESKRKEAEIEARRVAKEAKEAAKENTKAIAAQAALAAVAKGYPLDYVLSQPGIAGQVKKNELEAAVVSNPQVAQKARSTTFLSGDKALIQSALKNSISADGKTPTQAFLMAAPLLEQYKNARGGSWDALEGVGLSADQVRLMKMADAEARSLSIPFTQTLYKTIHTVPDQGKLNLSGDDRKALASAKEGLNVAQQQQLTEEFEMAVARGVSAQKALEMATETVSQGSVTVDGWILSNMSSVKNVVTEELGIEADDALNEKIAAETVKTLLGKHSLARFGSNQGVDQWDQLGGADGNLYFQHVTGGYPVIVALDDFKKTAADWKKRDAATGMSVEQERMELPERFDTIGAGYPVRK